MIGRSGARQFAACTVIDRLLVLVPLIVAGVFPHLLLTLAILDPALAVGTWIIRGRKAWSWRCASVLGCADGGLSSGHFGPLIDTGQMRDSIAYVVRNKRAKTGEDRPLFQLVLSPSSRFRWLLASMFGLIFLPAKVSGDLVQVIVEMVAHLGRQDAVIAISDSLFPVIDFAKSMK
jgi:hypothetical protein